MVEEALQKIADIKKRPFKPQVVDGGKMLVEKTEACPYLCCHRKYMFCVSPMYACPAHCK